MSCEDTGKGVGRNLGARQRYMESPSGNTRQCISYLKGYSMEKASILSPFSQCRPEELQENKETAL